MDQRKAEQKIRKAEQMLRSEFNCKVLPLYEEKFNKLEQNTAEKILNCLKDKNLGFVEKLTCKEEVLKKSLETRSASGKYLNRINIEIQNCLDLCKTKLTERTEDCYVNCLDFFRKNLDDI